MITITFKITELKPGTDSIPPVVCMEYSGQSTNATTGERSMANQFCYETDKVMKKIMGEMGKDGFSQGVFGEGDTAAKAIELVKAKFADHLQTITPHADYSNN